ncbi:MAG: ABC transporter permease [Oscillospiraceae bacterium]|nr:ABC transporter permease [Oscillospiraceae bacterium]
MKRTGNKKRAILWAVVCVVLALAAAGCSIAVAVLGRMLPPQLAAQRWQGDGETPYGQVTCFLPVDEKIDLNGIYQFRYAILDKLHEAGFEADTDTRLFRDAWSTGWKAKTSSALGHGEASITAVGGHFFDIHPLRLLSGHYISEEDLMKDQVLLDEDMAWLLFGSTDIQGMEMQIEGVPFVVAGVIEREQDPASKAAYSAGRGLYMSFDAFLKLQEGGKADCYELVMAEPVDSFVVSFVREKFPIGQGEIVENSRRYDFWSLLKMIGKFGSRSMQTHGVIYPYWENAARSVEDWSALLLLIGILCALPPVVTGLVWLIRLLGRGREKLADDILPRWKDRTEEAVRKRQRRAWEKRHPGEK